MNIIGHHHISMYTKDAKENKQFYTEVLGLRLVEKSVNQDDTTMYHLFYGDKTGSPGTLLTFFELPMAGAKREGTDAIYRLSLLVPNEDALAYFEKRLDQNNTATERTTYLGQQALIFKDPDELEIILIANNDFELPHTWQKNSYSDIPMEYQILGMGPVELRVRDKASTVSFLQDILGYEQRSDMTEDTVLTKAENGLYSDFVVIEEPGQRVRPGRGYIHHIAVNIPDDEELDRIYEKIQQQPNNNSGIIDRYFFKSLYYRQNSILYEFATAQPGFTVDTPEEELGQHLNLPDFLEDQREEIENKLHEI